MTNATSPVVTMGETNPPHIMEGSDATITVEKAK
jgi:hypothetical protein